MAFKLFKRNRRELDPISEEPAAEPEKPRTRGEELLEMCEDYGKLAKSFYDTRREYDVVTEYLSDCEKIANLDPETLTKLQSTAENIYSLNRTRDEYMNKPKSLSDSQMVMFDMYEDSIPDAINKLKEDEAYQDIVKRDMTYLEGEKLRWVMNKNELSDEMKKLRVAAIVVLSIFAVIIITMMVMYLGFEADITIGFVIAAFVAVVCGFVILVKYQNDILNTKIAKKNADKAITLLNKVKIKYVNITNAVDYERENYHVKDAREFHMQWEEYQEAVREREKFKNANTDLEVYSRKLLGMLSQLKLYDSQIWLEMPNVLFRTGDMVERRHELFTRRQKLRDKLNSYLEAITFQKKDIKRLLVKYPEYSKEVEDIVYMADKLIKEK